MTQELEWGGVQQLLLLLRSALLGVLLGIPFDILNGVYCGQKARKRFWSDLFFCVVAAIVTFFASLVLSNGRLHPILLIGVLFGLLLEHISLGRLLCRSTYIILRILRKWWGVLRVRSAGFCGRLRSKRVSTTEKVKIKSENVKKTRK